MIDKLIKNLPHSIVLSISFIFCFSLPLFGQQQFENIEKTEISGGAEFNIMLQEAIRNGNVDMFRYFGQPTPPPPYSPEAITTFLGFDFDDNGTYNSSYFIPPDPIAAAGNDRVIAVVNTMIECRSKTGTLLWQDDLAGFFTSLTPTTFTFDPKVIYDQYEDRFVVVDLEQVSTGSNPSAGNISRIFFAVSKTSTPGSATTTDWYFFAISAEESIGGFDYWADYPGFAIDEEAVYVTANMFLHAGASGGSAITRLWIVDKGTVGGFYGGGAASVTGGWDFPSLSSGAFAGTHQPAHVFGLGGVATGVGTFLVLYSGLSGGGTEFIQVIRVDDPLGTPSFSAAEFVSLGDIEDLTGALPDAPQLGSGTLIEVNDRRTLHAVWRNSSLWLTTTIDPNSGSDAGETTAHWIQLSTTTLGSTTLTDQGNIGGEDIASGTYTFFPSIAVNKDDHMIVGFSASASSIYAGAYYAGRFSGDPAGTVNSSVVIKAGLDYYVRIFAASGGTRNRWGDYSGASVDPSDDESFWIFNEYAFTRGTIISGEDGRWGTVYGLVPIGSLPVELSSFTSKVLRNGGVQLDWTTETEVDNYGFEIERTQLNEKDTLWEKLAFIEGHGNSNSPKDYTFTDRNAQYGNFDYRLKQIDTDGDFEYSKVIEVNAGLIPKGFVLEQNYPNPFNPSTTIKFALAETQLVELKVFDVLGNEVATLVNGIAEGGKVYEVEFKAENLSSGIYFYRLETGSKVENRKMLLLK